jgi:hypothetical protein
MDTAMIDKIVIGRILLLLGILSWRKNYSKNKEVD